MNSTRWWFQTFLIFTSIPGKFIQSAILAQASPSVEHSKNPKLVPSTFGISKMNAYVCTPNQPLATRDIGQIYVERGFQIISQNIAVSSSRQRSRRIVESASVDETMKRIMEDDSNFTKNIATFGSLFTYVGGFSPS